MLTRRKFGKTTGVVSVAALAHLLLPSCGSTSDAGMASGKNPYKKNLGLQLWTVREQLAADPVNTLKAIKKAGYKHVELQGSDNILEMKPITDDIGLAILSVHMAAPYITERWDLAGKEKAPVSRKKMLETHVAAGVTDLVLAYLQPEERNLDNYKRVAERMNEFGEECLEVGVQLSYHNHSFEFQPLETTTGWTTLTQEFDPELVKFELDVYWASVANKDPLDIMDQLGSRVHLLHLKDKKKGTPPFYDNAMAPPDSFKELGAGVLDFAAITEKAVACGVTLCMVEQDHSPDPLQSIKQSIDYYKKIG